MPGWPDALDTCVSKSDGGWCKCGKASYSTLMKRQQKKTEKDPQPSVEGETFLQSEAAAIHSRLAPSLNLFHLPVQRGEKME